MCISLFYNDAKVIKELHKQDIILCADPEASRLVLYVAMNNDIKGYM